MNNEIKTALVAAVVILAVIYANGRMGNPLGNLIPPTA
jgi:hypothetical protein